jgi:CheY-like chemotaxis protein/nitrogen-specific signal transduction histidine kinase
MGFFSQFFHKKNKQVTPKTQTDVTHLTELLDREFFKYNLDNSKTMFMCYLNGEGWIWANRRFLDTLGYGDIQNFLQQHLSVREIFLTESEEIFSESEKSWLDYIKKHQGHQVTLNSSEGEKLYLELSCYVYPRNTQLYVLKLEDVTQLHYAKLKTQEVENLKRKFLANIGHEFRTPMNGILGLLELMKQTQLDTKQQEYLDMIQQSSQSLMNNIEDLLNLSQLQSGRMVLEERKVNLLPLMEALSFEVYKLGKTKGVKVLSFIDPKLPVEVVCDADKIAQILHAITHNAIKFIQRGGRVIIEVKLLKRMQNGDCSISFGVKDNGSGISKEQIELLKEPFSAGSQADERLGVGLNLSHGLVRLMGSELEIQSEMNKGSYVHFTLDFKATVGQNFTMQTKKVARVLLLDQNKMDEANFLAIYLRAFAIDVVKSNVIDEHLFEGVDILYIVANQNDSSWMLEMGTYHKKIPVVILLDEDEPLQTRLEHVVNDTLHRPLLPSSMQRHFQNLHAGISTPTKLKHQESTPSQHNEIKVLVAEDNMINQRLIQILLQQYGLNISMASNGLEAVKMCQKNQYDLIFMDIDMPQMNGIVATKEIKSNYVGMKQPPVIALTAMAMDGDKEMLLKEGLDDYLSKPFTREKLEYVFEKYLQMSF